MPTYRLAGWQTDAIAALATKAGVSRSQIVRDLLAVALLDGLGSTVTNSRSTGSVQRLEVLLDIPKDDDAGVIKQAVAVRNDAAIYGRCRECRAEVEVMNSRSMFASSDTTSTPLTPVLRGRVVPSISAARPAVDTLPAPIPLPPPTTRSTVLALIDHQDDCSAALPTGRFS